MVNRLKYKLPEGAPEAELCYRATKARFYEEYYLWNLTNGDAFLNGAKPVFNLTGTFPFPSLPLLLLPFPFPHPPLLRDSCHPFLACSRLMGAWRAARALRGWCVKGMSE